MKFPFTKIFIKNIPEEKELLKDPHKESDHTLVDHTLKDPPKELPQEKEVPETPPKVPDTLPREKEIPNTLPKEKEVPKDSHDKKNVSCGYATKSEDKLQKPYQEWWITQMEVAKNIYPDCNQDQLNQIVIAWWDKKSDKTKINLWNRHNSNIAYHIETKKLKKIKKESVI